MYVSLAFYFLYVLMSGNYHQILFFICFLNCGLCITLKHAGRSPHLSLLCNTVSFLTGLNIHFPSETWTRFTHKKWWKSLFLANKTHSSHWSVYHKCVWSERCVCFCSVPVEYTLCHCVMICGSVFSDFGFYFQHIWLLNYYKVY